MAILTKEFLNDIGAHMDDATLEQFSANYETELDNRVINEIIDELTPEQAEQLTHYKNAGEQALQQWLAENVPNLAEIIDQETAILLGEIAEHSNDL